MCDPLTIGGLVLSAASVAANSVASSEVQSARDDSMEAERIRQAGFDREADAVNAHSQGIYKGFEGKQADRAVELGDILGKNQTPQTPSTDLLPQSASNVTVAEQGKQTGAAAAYGKQQSGALGNLRAFGDLLGEDSRVQARDAGRIGQIGDFKKGSANVLQLELQQDNQAGQGAATFGDILGGVGGLISKGSPSGLGSFFGGGNAATGVATSAPNFTYSSSLPANTNYGSGVLRDTGSLY